MRSKSFRRHRRQPKIAVPLAVADTSEFTGRAVVGGLELRPNTPLTRVRAKIFRDRDLSGLIPVNFVFLRQNEAWGGGEIPVKPQEEPITEISECLRSDKTQGTLDAAALTTTISNINTSITSSGGSLSRPVDEQWVYLLLGDAAAYQHGKPTPGEVTPFSRFGFATSDDQLARIVPDARASFFSSGRLFEAAEMVLPGAGLDQTLLPPVDVQSSLSFVRSLASLASRTRENSPLAIIDWAQINSILADNLDLIRCVSQRPWKGQFAAWWYGPMDRLALTEFVAKVRIQLAAAPRNTAPEAHTIDITFDPAGPQACAEKHAMRGAVGDTVSLSELKKDSSRYLRRQISNVLRISEADLWQELQNETKDEDRMNTLSDVDRRQSDPVLFRHRQSMIDQKNKTMARKESLEECLAPFKFIDDEIVDEMTGRQTNSSWKWALTSFDTWLQDVDNKHRVYVLAAAPGVGKTSVVSRIIKERSQTVLAYHFCHFDDSRFGSAKVMIMSIAYQISSRFPQYAAKINATIEEYNLTQERLMSDRVTLSTIFTEFIDLPLHSLDVQDEKLVIIIDGLDESYGQGRIAVTEPSSSDRTDAGGGGGGGGGALPGASSRGSNSTGTSRNEILDTIQRYFSQLPPWLNLYLTTRPMLPVLKRLRKFNATMVGPEQGQNTRDIRKFFEALIQSLNLYDDEQEIHAIVESLLHKAKGLFLYAAVIADRVQACSDNGEARATLENAPGKLEGLYEDQLHAITTESDRGYYGFNWSTGYPKQGRIANPSFRDNQGRSEPLTWRIIRLMFAAAEPLPEDLLADLANCDEDDLSDLLSSAPAFFTVGVDGRVRFHHKLVRDWFMREFGATQDKKLGDSFASLTSGEGGKVFRNSLVVEKVTPTPILASYTRRSSADSPLPVMSTTSSRFGGPDLSDSQQFMAIRCVALLHDETILNPELRGGTPATILAEFDERRQYLLKHGVAHLVAARMHKEARNLMLNVSWLMARANDGSGIVRDCELLQDVDPVIRLVGRAMALALPALRADPRQLPAQLVGRLLNLTAERRSDNDYADVGEEVSDFVRRLRTHDYGFSWWCPVSAAWDQVEETFLRRISGHRGTVQAVAWCPLDRRRLVSGSWDGTVRIWNVVTGNCEMVLEGHTSTVWSVAVFHDGMRVISGSLDKTVRVFDAKSAECLMILEEHDDSVFSVACSCDGSLIASGSRDKTIHVHDSNTGELINVLTGHAGWIYSINFSHEGQRLVSGATDNTVRIWNSIEGDCIQVMEGHSDWVRSVCWSVDDREVLSGSADHTVRIWDCATGECEQMLGGHEDSVWCVSQSSDGRHVASASTDGSVRIWDQTSGRCEQHFTAHTGPVWTCAFSIDGKKVVSGSSDKSIAIYDVNVGQDNQALAGHSASVWSVDISMDGTRLVSGSADKTLRVWDMTGNCTHEFKGHDGPVWAVALSSDARRIVSGSTDNTALIYHISSGERQVQLRGHTDSIWTVAWASNDTQVVTGSRDHSLRVWDAVYGRCLNRLDGHSGDVRSVSVSPSGTWLASGSSDKTIRVWNLERSARCEHILKIPKGGVLSVSFSSNGELIAAGSTDKSIRIWNWQKEECINLIKGHTRRVNSVCFDPHGKYVVSASTDKTIRVFDVEMGDEIFNLSGHTGLGVYSVKWSEDGRRLVSGSTDKTIRIWDAETGRCNLVLTGNTGLGIYCVAWSEDGSKIATGSRDRTIQIWNVETGQCERRLYGHTNWIYSVSWERGGRRIVSTSDDNTVRIWNVETGECEELIEESTTVPEYFDVVPSPCMTRDLSQRTPDGDPVGINFEKVQVFERKKKAFAWERNNGYMFELIEQRPQ